jgi:hypothetical protein
MLNYRGRSSVSECDAFSSPSFNGYLSGLSRFGSSRSEDVALKKGISEVQMFTLF